MGRAESSGMVVGSSVSGHEYRGIAQGIAVVGATGRLGAAIVRACAENSVPVLTVASTAGWCEGEHRPDVVIDASHPDALSDTVEFCARTRSPLLYCVSNPHPDQLDELDALSRHVAVTVAANLSALHWVHARTVELAARLGLAIGCDLETVVLDRHPQSKRDAPSATARVLHERAGGSGRIISERYGAPVNDHHVVFGAPHESLDIHHSVRDLRAAAAGALRLAAQATTLSAGRYTADELYAQLADQDRLPR
ncbi:dihydrodipicolinate reductase C-terminal domain-containing protein [Nocardia fluminea]|uniref:dihydrodipicolinate reductase C-terminal domain-containing protein n=1 Tax=Nocardia fluminea TaxID=134984 RepID=UPI0033DDC496